MSVSKLNRFIPGPKAREEPKFYVPDSIYEPLPSKRHFRVLRKVWPPPDFGPAPGTGMNELIIRSIDDPEPFSALSYRWGSTKPAKLLNIHSLGALVADNVSQFLEQQSLNGRSDDIFIDCLCIKQNDSKEKEVQVPLMGEIYSKAETTYLWFGDAPCPEYVSKAALARLPKQIDVYWQCMNHIYEADYWTRTWTVQEFLLAKSLVFMCGSDCLRKAGIGDFLQAMNRKDRRNPFVQDIAAEPYDIRLSRGEEWPHQDANILVKSHAVQLFYQKENEDSRYEMAQEEDSDDSDFEDAELSEIGKSIRSDGKRTLARVLIDHLGSAAGDPRDKVYGFLGLCTDQQRTTFPVDYSDSFDLVALFCRTMSFCQVHPDVQLIFAHEMRHNLGLNMKQNQELEGGSRDIAAWKESREGNLCARVWKVAVVGDGPASEPDPSVFKLYHMTSQLLACDPSTEERRDVENVVRNVRQNFIQLQQLPRPLSLDRQRLFSPQNIFILSGTEKTSFQDLEARLKAIPSLYRNSRVTGIDHLPMTSRLSPPHPPPLRQYTCKSSIPCQATNSPFEAARSTGEFSAIASIILRPGDVIYHAVGLDVSFVFRPQPSAYPVPAISNPGLSTHSSNGPPSPTSPEHEYPGVSSREHRTGQSIFNSDPLWSQETGLAFVGRAYLSDPFHAQFARGSGFVSEMQKLMGQAYPQILQGQDWKSVLDLPGEEANADLAPKELEGLKIVGDAKAFLELCR